MRPGEKMLGSRTQQKPLLMFSWCEKQEVWTEKGGWLLSLTVSVGLIKLLTLIQSTNKPSMTNTGSSRESSCSSWLTSCLFYMQQHSFAPVCVPLPALRFMKISIYLTDIIKGFADGVQLQLFRLIFLQTAETPPLVHSHTSLKSE